MRCFRPLGFSSPNLKHKASLRFFTHIILRLNGENTNLAKVSLDVKKAKNVTVYLYDSKRSEVKKVRVSIFIYLMSVSTSMLITFMLNLVFFLKIFVCFLQHMEGSHELESFNVNIVNGFNAFVSYIDIIVHTVDPFIISNLRLPLGECIENIKDTVSLKKILY